MLNLIATIIFSILGILSITASLFNFKWFFTSENGRMFVKLFGYLIIANGETLPDNPFQEKEMLKYLLVELLGQDKWEINLKINTEW